ncbi:hypothetical protein OG884_37095 [Streptosporangium sp. NBC_01755]|uniref:hypothetical protein n=1 Tax=unclassified Streptosporangium TaxID=2632669 RepID=UPI002DDC8EA2|nr:MULTISPECIES: hypothetical protein [unclassified Streptosporangium]WSA28209.1 hypothetical protein OIE13_10240 [Streptosporangium sp. NBC_01810]WSD00314.1 hypothetical protein OG884_37095 [Streptosporangium sp. NBC_01755]
MWPTRPSTSTPAPRNTSARWSRSLYTCAAAPATVRARLAELRAHIEGEGKGAVHAECYDVGKPGPGVEALLALVRALAVDEVLVDDAARFGRSAHPVLEAAQRPSVRVQTLEAIQEKGTHVPGDLQQRLREMFDDVDPDMLAERAPAWLHGGALSVARAQMEEAHAALEDAMRPG